MVPKVRIELTRPCGQAMIERRLERAELVAEVLKVRPTYLAELAAAEREAAEAHAERIRVEQAAADRLHRRAKRGVKIDGEEIPNAGLGGLGGRMGSTVILPPAAQDPDRLAAEHRARRARFRLHELQRLRRQLANASGRV